MAGGSRAIRAGGSVLALGSLALAARAGAQPAPPASSSAAAPAASSSAAAPEGYGGPAPSAHPADLPARTDLAPGEKRPAQDYDGRADVTSVGEDALWIPRVVFFPLWVVTEFFVRAPLGALTVAVEKNDVLGRLQDFLTFGPNHNIGIIPTGFVDFGFRPSVGLYFFWDDFIAPGNDLRASFGFGGIKYVKFGVADRIPISTPIGTERARSYFQLEADFLTRKDLGFFGVGPDTKREDEAGYGNTTYGGGGRVHIEPWRGTFFEGWVTARTTRTFEGECDGASDISEDLTTITRICDPPTLRRKILDGMPAPESYGRPYTTAKTGVRVVLDSRPKRPAPGHGVAVDVSAEHAVDFDEPKLGSWVTWGGSIAGFVDLTETQRVLSLTVSVKFQDTIEDGYALPFTELIGVKHNEDIPDGDLMKGFRPGRLVGRSSVAATLGYHWPIWAFLDGTLEAAVGNAFADPHLEDFELDKLRFSFVGGVRTPNHRDHSFNFLLGVGTETFEEGAEPNGLRFLFGGTTGF
ncbi:MAG TPA: hypothetical protein VL400_04465 [Polyangiaceae bacterium]|nr:hypothetical protein [Polyangiaceae bacterium]